MGVREQIIHLIIIMRSNNLKVSQTITILIQVYNHQIKFKMKIITFFSCLLLLLQACNSYLDILLNIHRDNNYISYSIPIKINSVDYEFSVSIQDNQQFIVPSSEKATSTKHKKHKQEKQPENLEGLVLATSLEGYSFEGWKRFFMEALLYIESRYYHDIKISLGSIQKKIVSKGNRTLDGLITFGPTLAENKIYAMIKNQSDIIKEDVVSIYRGINDKNARMQLGGFEQSFARGYRNGILFFQLDILSQNGRWRIPIKSISCFREKNGRDDVFLLTNSQLELSMTLQSPLLILPERFASDVQRNFQSVHSSCKITDQKRLMCTNMTTIDLSLNFIQFKIDSGAFINISLYDLRESYDQKSLDTVFYIEFTQDASKVQIGQCLFKSYYISIDMKNKKMLFSPINRFPPENYGVYIIRFLLGFGLFMFLSAIIAIIWQTFNDPFRKNKLMYGQEGVRLVTYQRPNEIEE